MYQANSPIIQTEVEGNSFPLERGVKQGDPLALKLFTAVLENQMRKLKWETKYGINIDRQRLTHLRFADDIIHHYLTSVKFGQRPRNDAERPRYSQQGNRTNNEH